MTKFILHVGDMKCGSTSIQGSLKEARQALRENGLVYEIGTSGINHCDLVRLVRPQTRGNLEESLSRGKQIVATLRETIKKGETVLLSAENLLTLPPEDFLPVLQQIAPEAPDVQVIAYVRRPTEMFLSHAQQALKGSRDFPQPDAYHRSLDRFLRAWRDCSFVSDLQVRPFDRARLKGGDVVEDFSAALQEAIGVSVALPKAERNRSLSAEQVIALQRLRRAVLPDSDGQLHPVSGRHIAWFTQLNRVAMVGRKPVLSPAAHSAVAQGNQDMLNRLNGLFPGLEMEQPTDSEAPAWEGGRDAEDILAGYSPSVVSHLTSLMPHLSPALAKGMTPEGRAAIETLFSPETDMRRKQMRLTKRFLQDLDCPRAARAIRPRTLSVADVT